MVMNTGVLAMLRIIPILTRARCGSGAAAAGHFRPRDVSRAGTAARRGGSPTGAPTLPRTRPRPRGVGGDRDSVGHAVDGTPRGTPHSPGGSVRRGRWPAPRGYRTARSPARGGPRLGARGAGG